MLYLDKQKRKMRAERSKLPAKDTGPKQPADYKRYTDQGMGGSREDNKRSRANNSWDSRLRNN